MYSFQLPETPRILMIGAGVLGTVYAAKLREAGHDVTIAERSPVRRAQITEAGGLSIRALDGSNELTIAVPLIDTPGDTAFDLAIVIARKTHLDGILGMLAPTSIPNVLFMMSNADGPHQILDALGQRALIGFPGAGGRVVDGVVEYEISPAIMQPTMLGEVGGAPSQRVRTIARLLKSAGFHPKVTPDIDAWLKSHEAFVASLGNATYIAGTGAGLSQDRELLDLNIRAVREIYAAMEKSGKPVQPRWFRAWNTLPLPLIRASYGTFVGSSAWDDLGTDQLHSMRDEVEVVTEELLEYVKGTGLEARSLAELARRRRALERQD